MPSIAYVRTISDYREFVCEVQRRAFGWWPIAISFLAGLVPMLVLIPIAGFWRQYRYDALMIGVLVATFTQLAIQTVSARFTIKLHARPHGMVLGNFTTALTETGVDGTGANFVSRHEWSGVEALTVSKSLLVIWVDTSAGIFIPRSAFATPDDEKAFIAYAEERIAASRPTQVLPV